MPDHLFDNVVCARLSDELYEMVVTIGEQNCWPNSQVVRKILEVYYDDWSAPAPGLEVIEDG